jgi:hypothetical protein
MKRLLSAAFLLFVFSASFAASSVPLRLEKGKTYTQVMAQNSKITQKALEMGMDMDVEIGYTTSYKVLEVKDTLFVTEATMSKMKAVTKNPEGVQEFSSDLTNVNDTTSMLLQELSKTPFKVTLTQSGKVAEIDINTAIDKAVNSVVALSEDQKVALKAQIEGYFGEEAMRQNIENAFAYNPPKAVKGERWSSNLKIKEMVELEQQNDNEVAEVSAEIVTVKFSGKMASPENAAPTSFNGMSAKYAISGTSEGSVTIDLKTGWIIKNTDNQAIKLTMDIQPNEQIPNGMQAVMTINTAVTITQ